MKRQTGPSSPATTRLHVIDGLRGCLALLVVVHHILVIFHCNALAMPAWLCVMTFFTMSGFVLARGYRGRPGVFILRRLVRLWPAYGVTLVVGVAYFLNRAPDLRELLCATFDPHIRPPLDLPAWSLCWEIWASPFLPFAFWLSAKRPVLFVAIPMLLVVGAFVTSDIRLFYPAAMLGGVAAEKFYTPPEWQVPLVVRWLGEISYSLYLTHFLVLLAGLPAQGEADWRIFVAVPAVPAVAWLVWRFVELPSIAWSRAVGRRNPQAAYSITSA